MKASELIQKLQDLKAYCGDVDVITAIGKKGDDPIKTVDAAGVRQVIDVGMIPFGEGAILLIANDFDEEDEKELY